MARCSQGGTYDVKAVSRAVSAGLRAIKKRTKALTREREAEGVTADRKAIIDAERKELDERDAGLELLQSRAEQDHEFLGTTCPFCLCCASIC